MYVCVYVYICMCLCVCIYMTHIHAVCPLPLTHLLSVLLCLFVSNILRLSLVCVSKVVSPPSGSVLPSSQPGCSQTLHFL